jgi:gamma-butyrobetaine dioxygenase
MPVSRNENNGQRLFSIIDIRKDLYIEEVTQDSEGNVCILFQPENHLSVFSQDWLRKNCYDLNNHFDDRSEKNKKLWQKKYL